MMDVSNCNAIIGMDTQLNNNYLKHLIHPIMHVHIDIRRHFIARMN